MLHQINFLNGVIVDSFAGGGGASTGIELALGRIVDIAINHDPRAIEMHMQNHPLTKRYREDVFNVDPVEVTQGKEVELFWLSPDCTHFSKAKGGKPVEKKIRGLAWIALKWAKKVRPKVIMLENVEEFQTWGPIKNGKPIKERKGETFKHYVQSLQGLGYTVEWKVLKACDYGAPTIRKRLFLIARCDGQEIVWPEPTHGNKEGLKPYRTAVEIIDWSIRGETIFERKKPLVDATLRRVARGIDKFVIKNSNPFILQYKFTNEPEDIEEPLSTITSVASQYLVTPVISQIGQNGFSVERSRSIEDPLSTIVRKNEHLLVTPVMAVLRKDQVSDIKEPVSTITGVNHHYVVMPLISQRYGEVANSNAARAKSVEEPLPTITAQDHNTILSAVMASYYGSGDNVAKVTEPVRTITAMERHALVKVLFKKVVDSNIGNWKCIRELLNTHANYNLADDEVLVFEINGVEYLLVDIEMRMLTPRELYRAQGFPDDYIIEFDVNGKPYSKKEQIARCGNSVSPVIPKALVRANRPDLAIDKNLELMQELNSVLNNFASKSKRVGAVWKKQHILII